MKKTFIPVVFAFTAIMLMSGCSSDTSSSEEESISTTLTGTAATGAPIDGTIFVKDAKGAEKSVATNVDGSFTLDVPDMTPPYILKVMPSSGPELYSYASKNGQTVNLTPTTNLAMFLAYGKKDLNDLYTGWNGGGVSSTAVDDAEAVVRTNLKTVMAEKGVDAEKFNLFTTSFSANGEGFDGVMDNLNITVDSAAESFTFTDGDGIDMAFDEGITPIETPVPPAPDGAISITTVNGNSHTLNGTYRTACYDQDSSDGRIDTLMVSGNDWINTSIIFVDDATCDGAPTRSGSISATLSKGADKTISGWKQGSGTPMKADGSGLLSDAETVTSFEITVTGIDDPEGVFAGFTIPEDPVPAFYVFDDTDSPNFMMWRDRDGDFASASDPYIRN